MDLASFEAWLQNLSDQDRAFLQKHPTWKKEYQKLQKSRVLPKGFAEKTMEVLEDGSESETWLPALISKFF